MPPNAPSPFGHGIRLPPPPAMPTCVPPLPTTWQGTDRMSDWLKAKAEEDRRRQEEERTRQAQLILELRRVEQAMISDSLRAGVPPHMVPMIFSGIHTTGANPHLAMELQRQWSAPVATIPQHTPQQVFPISHPYPPTLHQSAPQAPEQASQQPPQPPQVADGKLHRGSLRLMPGTLQYALSESKSQKHFLNIWTQPSRTPFLSNYFFEKRSAASSPAERT